MPAMVGSTRSARRRSSFLVAAPLVLSVARTDQIRAVDVADLDAGAPLSVGSLFDDDLAVPAAGDADLGHD
jgi:hypothetical protein